MRTDGAELGHAHLEIGQQLKQEGLELLVRLVDFVDQQDDLSRRGNRSQQRPLEQVFAREEMLGKFLPMETLMLVGLEAQQLLLIVPFVESTRLVESLV